MKQLEHRGYYGSIEHDLEAGLLHGRVLGLRDVIHYEAKTLQALAREFRRSVDIYLELCEEKSKVPDRPYSGRFNARLSPEVHRQAASLAEIEGLSLNDLVTRALTREIEAAKAGGR